MYILQNRLFHASNSFSLTFQRKKAKNGKKIKCDIVATDGAGDGGLKRCHISYDITIFVQNFEENGGNLSLANAVYVSCVLFFYLKENDDDYEDEDDEVRRKKPPGAGIDMQKVFAAGGNKEDIMKISKKGQPLMMFVNVAGNPTKSQTETVSSFWQTSLRNNNIQVQR